jgi:hypothetical protein
MPAPCNAAKTTFSRRTFSSSLEQIHFQPAADCFMASLLIGVLPIVFRYKKPLGAPLGPATVTISTASILYQREFALGARVQLNASRSGGMHHCCLRWGDGSSSVCNPGDCAGVKPIHLPPASTPSVWNCSIVNCSCQAFANYYGAGTSSSALLT